MILNTLLKFIRVKTGMNRRQMAEFLGIPPSTYRSYENNRMNPKIEFYERYEDKAGIVLRRSLKEGVLCFTDTGEKFKTIQKKRASPYKTPVYFNHTIQDLVYSKTPLEPAFRIRIPGSNPGSFCIKIQIGFVICKPEPKPVISSKYQYLFVMKDGKDKTGSLTDGNIDLKTVYKAFRISHILTEDELIAWMI